MKRANSLFLGLYLGPRKFGFQVIDNGFLRDTAVLDVNVTYMVATVGRQESHLAQVALHLKFLESAKQPLEVDAVALLQP